MKPGILRLLHLREQTEAVGEEMATQRKRFKRLASDEAAPRVVTSFNLFQTPPVLATQAAQLLLEHLAEDAKILEPSAGLGRLYLALRQEWYAGKISMVEQSADCCRELYQLTDNDPQTSLKQADFLAVDDLGLFDGILMNPPFKMGRDIKHIKHALTMLKPGGRLVSFCANGPRQNKQLKSIATDWQVLPAGSFKSEGTSVESVLLIIDKE